MFQLLASGYLVRSLDVDSEILNQKALVYVVEKVEQLVFVAPMSISIIQCRLGAYMDGTSFDFC